MHAYEAIEQSLTYIEEHLTKEISTEKLANTVGLSPFYFQRLFKRLVNKPVQEYVKLRRLAKVIENLKSTEQRILDAALDYGFSSHANFTRAFKETYGITPENYKKDLPMLNTFDKPEVSMNYVLVDEGVPLVVGNIVLEIQRKTLEKPEIYFGLETEVRISEQIPIGDSTGVDAVSYTHLDMSPTSILAGIPETDSCQNTQSYGRLHCLPTCILRRNEV